MFCVFPEVIGSFSIGGVGRSSLAAGDGLRVGSAKDKLYFAAIQ